MAVIDLYSKRMLRAQGGAINVFTYDFIPAALRAQIVHIWGDALGIPYHSPPGGIPALKIQGAYHSIVLILRREYGVFSLTSANKEPNNKAKSFPELQNWFLTVAPTERAIDTIELTFRAIDRVTRSISYLNKTNSAEIADNAIFELNARFKEHGVGYQYSDGHIIRVDSQLIHAEAVVPALHLLRDPLFANVQSEFLSAFDNFRHGKSQEALIDCCKSFESTMKVICDKRGWAFDASRATASELIRVCYDNGLIPPYWQTHFGGLRSVLESAIPTPRNKQAGHGAGSALAQQPPEELVSYVLHLTASTILFLVEAEKQMR